MYNRYIPQSDGSYRKNRMPESEKPKNRPRSNNVKQDHPPQVPEPLPICAPKPSVRKNQNPPKTQSAGSFLRHLLPQGLDTGDLLIAVLLLLMAGDCQEDKNTALLTLALYLFL